MNTYSAVILTDAWDDDCDSMIVSFEAWPNSSSEVLVKAAKLAFAKDIYEWDDEDDERFPPLPENVSPEEGVRLVAEREEKLLAELDADHFYVKIVGIFPGKSLIDHLGVEV